MDTFAYFSVRWFFSNDCLNIYSILIVSRKSTNMRALYVDQARRTARGKTGKLHWLVGPQVLSPFIYDYDAARIDTVDRSGYIKNRILGTVLSVEEFPPKQNQKTYKPIELYLYTTKRICAHVQNR